MLPNELKTPYRLLTKEVQFSVPRVCVSSNIRYNAHLLLNLKQETIPASVTNISQEKLELKFVTINDLFNAKQPWSTLF